MDWFSFIVSLSTIITSSAVSIVTVRHQTKINEDNNKRLLEAEKLNNENQLKLKHLDYYYSEKNSAVCKYLDDLFDYLDEPSQRNFHRYQTSMAKASMYVSSSVYEHIDLINCLIKGNNLNEVRKTQIDSLIDSLCSDNQQYK